MITQKELKEILSYNPDTGVFTWCVDIGRARVGYIAGTNHLCGYRHIGIKGKMYLAHRLAWLYVYGYFPKEIDHDNRVRHDNRISNLVSVDRLANSKNHTMPRNNKSGVVGVIFDKTLLRWRAFINNNKKRIELGKFKHKNDAIIARKMAEHKYNYHVNHGTA